MKCEARTPDVGQEPQCVGLGPRMLETEGAEGREGGERREGGGKSGRKGGMWGGSEEVGLGGGNCPRIPRSMPCPPPPLALPHRLLVSAPWDGPQGDHRGELYKCPLEPPNGTCTKSNLGTGGGARGVRVRRGDVGRRGGRRGGGPEGMGGR